MDSYFSSDFSFGSILPLIATMVYSLYLVAFYRGKGTYQGLARRAALILILTFTSMLITLFGMNLGGDSPWPVELGLFSFWGGLGVGAMLLAIKFGRLNKLMESAPVTASPVAQLSRGHRIVRDLTMLIGFVAGGMTALIWGTIGLLEGKAGPGAVGTVMIIDSIVIASTASPVRYLLLTRIFMVAMAVWVSIMGYSDPATYDGIGIVVWPWVAMSLLLTGIAYKKSRQAKLPPVKLT